MPSTRIYTSKINFAMIAFLGANETRQMKLTLFNKEGKELWNKVILKKELE